MNCDKLLDYCFLRDKNERMPLRMKLHLIYCPSCRITLRRMHTARILQSKRYRYSKVDNDLLLRTMQHITLAAQNSTPAVAIEQNTKIVCARSWGVAGVLLTLFIAVPILDAECNKVLQLDNIFSLAIAFLYAGSITVYLSLFVVQNMSFLTHLLQGTRKLRRISNP